MADNFTPELVPDIRNRLQQAWQDTPLARGLHGAGRWMEDTGNAAHEMWNQLLASKPEPQDIELKPETSKSRQRLMHEQILKQMKQQKVKK